MVGRFLACSLHVDVFMLARLVDITVMHRCGVRVASARPQHYLQSHIDLKAQPGRASKTVQRHEGVKVCRTLTVNYYAHNRRFETNLPTNVTTRFQVQVSHCNLLSSNGPPSSKHECIEKKQC